MTHKVLVIATLVSLAVALVGCGAEPTPASEPPATPAATGTIVLGKVSDNPTEKLEEYQPLADYLAANLGDFGIAVGKVAPDLETMAHRMVSGEVDLYFDNPYAGLFVSDLSGGQPLLFRVKEGAGEKHAVFFTRADSGLTSLADLEGQLIAVEEPTSASGYMLPVAYLIEAGLNPVEKADPDSAVAAGEVGYVFSYDDDNTVQWVRDGRVIAGAVDGEARSPTREPFDAGKLRLAATIADQAASALHRAALHEQTEQRLQRLTALRNIDMAIIASLDLRFTLNVILDQIMTQLGADAADVLLLNPHTQTLEYAAGRGFHTDAITHSRLRLGEGCAGRIALERRPLSISNLAEGDDFSRAASLADENFSAYYGVPLIAKGQIRGVLDIFHRAPRTPVTELKVDPEWLSFAETLAGQAAIAIDNAELFDNLQRANLGLTLAYDTTLEGWAKALELRDRETEGHTRRVTDMTLRLARAMEVSDEELVHVRRGALLHDIGKMGIPDSILLKPGELTDEEWDIMRQHPVYAYEMLAPIDFLRPALDIPHCHHERWDGTGYPRGLKGEEIPLAARIFAVVDVYDALTSDRPYRDAWPEEKVLEHMREQVGKHFDPEVVEVFMEPGRKWGI